MEFSKSLGSLTSITSEIVGVGIYAQRTAHSDIRWKLVKVLDRWSISSGIWEIFGSAECRSQDWVCLVGYRTTRFGFEEQTVLNTGGSVTRDLSMCW